MVKPTIVLHDGILVARDDLYPGGTKARYFAGLFDAHDHVVYASPCEGGAQTALAFAAREADKQCTIFVAERKAPHPRSLMAKAYGATVVQVEHGYLNVVQSKAREFCRRTGAYELPFGGAVEGAEQAIADAAMLATDDQGKLLVGQIDEVWCAGGSGTLARGLGRAFPKAFLHVVEVGRSINLAGVGTIGYQKHEAGMPFGRATKAPCPFPSDPHYDRKAWAACVAGRNRDARTLFWNVTGPAKELT